MAPASPAYFKRPSEYAPRAPPISSSPDPLSPGGKGIPFGAPGISSFQKTSFASETARNELSYSISSSQTAGPSSASSPDPTPPDTRGQERMKPQEVRYFVQQIHLIVKPVLACIFLSILWSKLALLDKRADLVNISGATESAEAGLFLNSLANAAIIIGQLIAMTVILVLLFKYKWYKTMYAILGLTVVFLFGFTGWILASSLLNVLRIPADYISVVFSLWNISVAGIISIFWITPKYLQQAALVLVSSLMAFSLTNLEEWTTWALLGLLVVWDLVAVLCPFGPLRLLIKKSQQRGQDIPALLYAAAIFIMMADLPMSRQQRRPNPGINSTSLSHPPMSEPQLHQPQSFEMEPMSQSTSLQQSYPPHRRASRLVHKTSGAAPMIDTFRTQSPSQATGRNEHRRSKTPETPLTPGAPLLPDVVEIDPSKDEHPEDRGSLRLGLGDFVFYSVLIGRASLSDWVTTLACLVAVMTGLSVTIFLLGMTKRSLPALPISIVLGVIFYFVGSEILVPYLGVVQTSMLAV